MLKEELRTIIDALEGWGTSSTSEDAEELHSQLLDRAKALDTLSEEDLAIAVGIAHAAVREEVRTGNDSATVLAAARVLAMIDGPEAEEDEEDEDQ